MIRNAAEAPPLSTLFSFENESSILRMETVFTQRTDVAIESFGQFKE